MSTNGGKTFTNITGATALIYSFKATASETGYAYRAVFTNSKGSTTTSAATLTVPLSAPAVTTNPKSQSVIAGSTATFTVAATGNPTPTVQWELSTNGGKSFANIKGASSLSYSFKTAISETGYEYRAVFTNSKGSATSAGAKLTVTAPLVALAVGTPTFTGEASTL